MSVKLTVVYDNPKDPAAFEQHYNSIHVPLAQKIPGVRRAELAKVFPKEDGSPTPAYRVAELHFDDYASSLKAIANPEGHALIADAKTLGSSGVKFLLCDIEGS